MKAFTPVEIFMCFFKIFFFFVFILLIFAHLYSIYKEIFDLQFNRKWAEQKWTTNTNSRALHQTVIINIQQCYIPIQTSKEDTLKIVIYCLLNHFKTNSQRFAYLYKCMYMYIQMIKIEDRTQEIGGKTQLDTQHFVL